MPGRNVLKVDRANSYYHVYARGAQGQPIFLEHADFMFFLQLFARYLGEQTFRNSAGVPYEKLHGSIELLAYCLMGNHFHLLLYQTSQGGMQRLMRGVMTAYSRYCNSKYQRSGQLFESRYRAAIVSDDSNADYVSRYIHTVPKDWEQYPYSSIGAYITETSHDWLKPERIMKHFYSPAAYRTFVGDRQSAQGILGHLQKELANDITTTGQSAITLP